MMREIIDADRKIDGIILGTLDHQLGQRQPRQSYKESVEDGETDDENNYLQTRGLIGYLDGTLIERKICSSMLSSC